MNKKQFCGMVTVWSVSFLLGGQFLFGCAPMKAAQEQWGASSVATIQEQGKTDREFLVQQGKCNDCSEKETTTIEAPASLNIPTKKTVIQKHTRFILGEGETTIPEKTIEETDHAALSVLVMGEALKVLAGALNKNNNLQSNNNSSQQQKRIVYKTVPQPKVDTISGIIGAGGDAVAKQSWVGNIFQWGLVMSGMKDIARAPNYIVNNSNNPETITVKTTTGVEQ